MSGGFGEVEFNAKDGSQYKNVFYRTEPAFVEEKRGENDKAGTILVRDGEWSNLAERLGSAFVDEMNEVEGLNEKTPGLAWESKITNED